MRVLTKLAWALLVLLAMRVTPLRAVPIYWYSGDVADISALTSNSVLGTFVFEQFNVGPGGVSVTGVFGNFETIDSPDPTAAAWEILSGVSAGNGGPSSLRAQVQPWQPTS